MLFTLKLLATVLLADLVAGLVHWAEDAYARPDSRHFGRIAVDNLVHHARPREFLARSWWQSSRDLVLAGLVVLALAAATGLLTGWVVLFVVLAANANQVHKWAHSSRRELPAPVYWLQRLRLLQTPRHHALHHRGARDSHYCVLTNLLNPVLEALRFWTALEWLVLRTTGVRRRNDADWAHALPPRGAA